jgi:L-lysine exporter family protein LysE/ArgO
LFFNILGVLGSLFLFYLSFQIYKNRDKKLESKQDKVEKKDGLKLYMQGFILTLLNPYTIAFWLSTAGYILHKELDTLFTILGMLSAITLWITLMPYFVYKSKHKISQKISSYINIFSFIILFGFALSLFINVILNSF